MVRETVDWYFDVVSPYVYVQLDLLDQLASSAVINPKPVLLGALFQHWGSKAPADIAPKRLHIHRHCAWLAKLQNRPYIMPKEKPYVVTLSALRLLCALGPTLQQVKLASNFIFAEGGDPGTPEGLVALARSLGVEDPEPLVASEAAKLKLRHNTDEAISRGVWGVPTTFVRDRLFWGVDTLPMMIEFLNDPARFEAPIFRPETLSKDSNQRDPATAP